MMKISPLVMFSFPAEGLPYYNLRDYDKEGLMFISRFQFRIPAGLLRSENIVLLCFVLIKLSIHLLTSQNYGYHGDEFYYIAASRHPDFGYVDMPPLIPLLM